MADDYQSALRSCYYKSILGNVAPNPADPMHQEFVDSREKNNTRFIVLFTLGVPLIYFTYTKVMIPRLPGKPYLQAFILSALSLSYIIGIGTIGFSKHYNEVLTNLAWKYERDMHRLCPDVAKYMPARQREEGEEWGDSRNS